MADFSIPITIPAGKTATVMAALNWHYGKLDDNGTLRDRTAAELKAVFKAEVEQKLKDVFQRYNQHLRDQTPFDTEPGIT
jgi:hypothetical protein